MSCWENLDNAETILHVGVNFKKNNPLNFKQ